MSICFRRSAHQVIFLVVLAVAVAAAQPEKESAEPIISALRNNQPTEALRLLGPALQATPGNPQLWVLQGLAYLQTGNRESALVSYQNALKISPDYLAALEGAAQVEYEAGSPNAIPLLDHVIRLRPHDATAHAMLGAMAAKKGDCATAVSNFAEGGPALSNQHDALHAYGSCLLKLKQQQKAVQVFEQLLATRPDDPRARRDLAAVQLDAGDATGALSTLQPLLSSTTDINTMRLAADIYEANGDTPNAVKVLRDAIVTAPSNVDLYLDFAEIALNHQSFQTGIEMINSGLKLQPASAQLYLARGVLYVQLAKYEEAQADFEKAEQLDPIQGLTGAAQGMLAEEKDKNDPEQALRTIEAKLAKNPRDAFLWYLKAATISQKSPLPDSSDFQQGIDAAKRAVTLQPSLGAAHNVLAKYYLDSGQSTLAVKECRLALEQNSDDQTALYHLVMALRKTNDQSEIPDLLKRLAAARQKATRDEGEKNRYKLVVVPDDAPK
jgi:tetratricopeptide (TPR) repeat protein